jgi:hypothetical protein
MFVISILGGCADSESNTTSYVKILEKESTEEGYFVIVENPNDSETGKFKLNVDNENTWNLLVVGNTYLASYHYKSLDNNGKLGSIQIPNSDS